MSQEEKQKDKKEIPLNIELGCKLFIQIEGIKERLSSALVGMASRSYLIVRTPVMTGIEYMMKEGCPVVIRYVHLGEVYGFQSVVLRSITHPSRITFISFPDQIEKINLRKKPRIGCFIPASLSDGKSSLKGVIKNLSTEGIKFTIKILEDAAEKNIKVGNDIAVNFPLLGIEGIQEINGKIRNKNQNENEMDFGIEFYKKDARTIEMIDSYIKQVMEYL